MSIFTSTLAKWQFKAYFAQLVRFYKSSFYQLGARCKLLLLVKHNLENQLKWFCFLEFMPSAELVKLSQGRGQKITGLCSFISTDLGWYLAILKRHDFLDVHFYNHFGFVTIQSLCCTVGQILQELILPTRRKVLTTFISKKYFGKSTKMVLLFGVYA